MDKAYLDHYREHGYAVVRGLFSADEIAELSAAFDRLYAEGMTHRASYRHQNVFFRIGRDANLGRIVRMVQWPSYVDPVMNRFRLDRRMAAVLTPLIGPDARLVRDVETRDEHVLELRQLRLLLGGAHRGDDVPALAVELLGGQPAEAGRRPGDEYGLLHGCLLSGWKVWVRVA